MSITSASEIIPKICVICGQKNIFVSFVLSVFKIKLSVSAPLRLKELINLKLTCESIAIE